jgi:hypothetical protein
MFCSKEESDMDHATLTRAVQFDAALRRRQPLQPVGGEGDKIFPPTYPEERGQGPRHVFERRRVDGREAWCVYQDARRPRATPSGAEGALLLRMIVEGRTARPCCGIGRADGDRFPDNPDHEYPSPGGPATTPPARPRGGKTGRRGGAGRRRCPRDLQVTSLPGDQNA